MRIWIILACAFALGVADEKVENVEADPESLASRQEILNRLRLEEDEDRLRRRNRYYERQRLKNEEEHDEHHRLRNLEEHDLEDDHGVEGPAILRLQDPHGPNKWREEEEIIKDVYGPVYAEKTWVIDYRWLPTGGRDYVRGPGGQLVILPKHVKVKGGPGEYHNFDALLERLKHKHLLDEHQSSRRPNERGERRENKHDTWRQN